MRFGDIFAWRLRYPTLSGDALILLLFIAYRMNISSYEDENGKYIFLNGSNDPASELGYSRRKMDKIKKELKENGLIVVKRRGVCQPAKIHLTLEMYSPDPSKLSRALHQNGANDAPKLWHQNGANDTTEMVQMMHQNGANDAPKVPCPNRKDSRKDSKKESSKYSARTRNKLSFQEIVEQEERKAGHGEN